MTISNKEVLLADVKDLLNQALILMKDVPEGETDDEIDSYDYGPSMKVLRFTEESAAAYNKEHKPRYEFSEGDEVPGMQVENELSALKAMINVLAKSRSAQHMFEQYYNSNC